MLSPVQISKRLQKAAGFLELEMPAEALDTLAPIEIDGLRPLTYLRATALNNLHRYDEAWSLYARMLDEKPGDVAAAVGKAWCEKRLGRLDDAIATLEESARRNPREAILQYNLACYHALRTEKSRCLTRLGVAIRLDRGYADLIGKEADFDSLRDDADFASLIAMASGDR